MHFFKALISMPVVLIVMFSPGQGSAQTNPGGTASAHQQFVGSHTPLQHPSPHLDHVGERIRGDDLIRNIMPNLREVEEQNINQGIIFNRATGFPVTLSSSPGAINHIKAIDLQRIDILSIADAFGVSAEKARLIRSLPSDLDGEPVAYLKASNESDGRLKILHGRSVLNVDPDHLPVLAPAFSTFVRGVAPKPPNQDHEFVRFGDPVDDVPTDAIPGRGGEVLQTNWSARDNLGWDSATGQCGRSADLAECYLPTVALHSRRRTSCSGALIGPKWVLTAAHCACRLTASKVTIGSRANLEIGRYTRSPSLTINLTGKIEFFSDEFCPAFETKPADPATYKHLDLALVELSDAVVPQSVSPFAMIGRLSEVTGSEILQIAGFGARETDRWGGEKYVTGIAVSSADCNSIHLGGRSAAQLFGCVPGMELVAIDSNLHSDSCYGDSGAPAYTKLSDGRLVLVALVSRGITGKCGPGGIYTLVVNPEVHRWVREHVPSAKFLGGDFTIASEFSSNNQHKP